ncbi:MAG: hypothetical protein HC927_08540 [Deltaproteobacteria bacterium]|nr:hypothetical protein [Deltaproteobacteria bacterium]
MSARLPPDFADLFVCLNEAGVDYMLVGGYAVNSYGFVRATEDLDIWVRATPKNAERLMEAMRAFGLPPGLTADDMAQIDGEPPTGFRFGRRPFAVDLLTSIQMSRSSSGCSRRMSERKGSASKAKSAYEKVSAKDKPSLQKICSPLGIELE